MYRANRGYPNGGNFMGHETLEERNQELEGELKGKISALKSLSIDIGTEVREQNRLLKDMDDDFDSTGSMFSNTISKIYKIARSPQRYYIYYLLLFCVFVFVVLWFYIK